MILTLIASCAIDYENNDRIPNQRIQGSASGLSGGAILGQVSPIYSSASAALPHGALAGFLIGSAMDSDWLRIYRLNDVGIKVIEYGDNITVVVPSDYFFYVDSSDLRMEREFSLIEIASLINKYPRSPISIMAFSDSVGSDKHAKELTLKQSHSILSFLWSHGIDKKRLFAFGNGKYPTIADTYTVLGNGLNRRVEITWRKKT